MKTNDNNIALPRVLIYQSESCDVMANYIASKGYEVIRSTDDNIRTKIKKGGFDICVLDHYPSTLPGNACLFSDLRKSFSKIPLIVVSDLSRPDYVIKAFNTGADDYLARPYNLEELSCRIKALLRRCGISMKGIEKFYRIGSYLFNVEEGKLTREDAVITLTKTEINILTLLSSYKNTVLPKKILMDRIWVADNYFNRRSLDVYMCRLRNYLALDKSIKIETIRGAGYSLVIE